MSANGSLQHAEQPTVQNKSEDTNLESFPITLDTAKSLPNLEHGNTDSMIETSPECFSEDSHSLPCSISIKFHDEAIADLYKLKFMKFISSFTGLCVHDDGIVIKVFRDKNVCNNEESTAPCAKKRKKHSKAKKELFVVDATPSDAVETDLRYITKFTIGSEKAGNAHQNSKSSCFNCGQAHAIKDCTEPKDYAKIAAARQKFKTQFKSSRYHLEDQKFNHLQPGKISSELKRALGLQKNEAPHYIYLMRKLGYPPGWLEDAKFVHSNLDMFDIDGKNVKSETLKQSGLDENKIVDYPGFNVPFQKGVKDDYRGYKVPPYSENFSKEAMVAFFDKQVLQEQDSLEICDMEVEPQPNIPELIKKKDKEAHLKESLDRDSPSLTDLEQQKLQLLEELNEEPKDEVKDADLEKEFLAIKTSCFGTPLLKSNSPYSTLPDADNFSKDVSPVINFENLPNSTGKYELLTDVLQKVRQTLKNEHNCST